MPLVTFADASPIVAADLDANFAIDTAAVTAQAAAGQCDEQHDVERLDLTSAISIRDRSFEWTPQDDLELRQLRLAVFGNAATVINITLTLEAVDAGGTYNVTTGHPTFPEYLLNKAISLTVTSNASAEFTGGVAYTSTAGDRHWLLGGITYRLTLSSDNAATVDRAYACAITRARRRAA